MKEVIDTPVDFSGILQGIVIKRDDPKKEGRVGVYIPKLMFNLEEINLDEELSINESSTLNENNSASTNKISGIVSLETVNYYWARPLVKFVRDSKKGNRSGEIDVPQLGEKIPLIFIDEDPQKCYYMNSSITLDGDNLPIKNLEGSESSKSDEIKRPNIKVFFEAPNGNIIGMDYNEEVNSFVIKFEGKHKFIMIDNPDKSEIRIEDKNGNKIVIDSLTDNITINAKKNVILNNQGNIDINSKGNSSIISEGNVTVEAAGTLSLKTADSATWLPNMIPNCLFTGAPHGGPAGGISNLKGK